MSAPNPPEAEPPRPPTVEALQAALPQFEVLELIGIGGMGTVYKAKQPKLDRLVAIKLLSAELSADGEFEKRFLSEARAMAKMVHNRIVTVYDFGETDNGWLYIVMEYVEGHDLNHLIEKGALPTDHALAIATQICDALAYAHERHLVHQDIKPANIMLDVEGQVKVTDFGLAKMVAAGDQNATDERSGIVMGSPEYVAPERLETGKEGDHRGDIFSLGVTIYEMLTGETPRSDYVPPSVKNPELDPRIDPVVARAMANDRNARYQGVAELWQDLDLVRTAPKPQLSTPAAGAARKAPAVPQKKSRTGLVVTISIVVLATVAALLIDMNGKGTPQAPDPAAGSPQPAPVTPEPEPGPPEIAVAPDPEPAPVAPQPEPSPQPVTPPVGLTPGRPTEASVAVAGLVDRFKDDHRRAVAAGLNDYYRSALEREIAESQTTGKAQLAVALQSELDVLLGASGAPIQGDLPDGSPQRLIELRKIYNDSLQKKLAGDSTHAAEFAESLDSELQKLQAGYLAQGKQKAADEIARARTGFRNNNPFVDAPPKPVLKQGRFRAWGATAKGQPYDISSTEPYDDFVAVDYHMDEWAAVRSNGQVFSSQRRLNGLEGVAETLITGPRSYVRYLDGRLESRPSYEHYNDDIENAIQVAIGITDGLALLEDGTIKAWGKNFNRPGHGPPPGLSDIVDIATTWGSFDNPSYGFALTPDGKITVWGRPDKPFKIPADLPPVKQIEAGWTQLLCLLEDGSVVNLPRPGERPHSPPDDLPPAVRIHARGPFYAIQDIDGVWTAWGHNRFGVVDKVNEVGVAHAITFKGNRWHAVLWIEPTY